MVSLGFLTIFRDIFLNAFEIHILGSKWPVTAGSGVKDVL